MSTASHPRPETAKSAFVRLLARGFWPIAIRSKGEPIGDDRAAEGKEPIGKAWGLRRWTLDDANAEFLKVRGRGVGICLGPGRGPDGAWLVDVEGDGPDAILSRLALFDGEEVDSMGWASARGEHLLLAVDPARMAPILPGLKGLEGKGQSSGVYKTPMLAGLELRLGGYKPDGTVKQLQSVVPPTPGTDGSARAWVGPPTVAPAPEAFYATLERLAPKPAARTADPKPAARPIAVHVPDGDRVARRVANYAATALAGEADLVASASEGNRHDTLRAASMNMAGLVKSDQLTESMYRMALMGAAAGCGLPEGEARQLLDSALELAQPRDLTRAREWRPDRPAPDGPRAPLKLVGDDQVVEPPAPPDDVPPGDGDGGGPEGKRPEIEINPEWHLAVAAGIGALGADPDLYCRGGELVKVVRESEDTEKVTSRTAFRDVAGTPKVMALSPANVGVRLTKVATFFEWKEVGRRREPKAVPVGPPPWLVKSIATHGHWPGIRPLLSVAECPFPRPDGSIVEEAGYDAQTATILLPSIEFPPIPERPVRDDARAASERLMAYVDDFPFASEDDRVVYLAGLLTVIARPAVEGPVPGFAVIGNRAGTGKGLLIDCMTIPGTGRVCPTSAYPDEKDEAVKVKVSIAKAGKAAVHFDNLDEGDSYGSGPLDSALTSTVVDDRQLGSNESPPLPLRTAWFLSGNNVTPSKDAYRRWLPCHIRTELENPEERTDIKRPRLRADIIADRGLIVRDALTILKAHSMHGRPHPDWPGFGSFEDWSDVVRGAVWYATGRDCLATQRTTSASSPERMLKVALLEGLSELPGAVLGKGRGVTAKEAVDLVESEPSAYETLRGALIAKGRAGKLASSGSLGNIFRGLKDSLIEGYRLHEVGQKHKVALWAIEVVDGQDRGVYGSGGSVSSPIRGEFTLESDMMAHGGMAHTICEGPETDPPDPQTPTQDEDWTRRP